MITSEALDLSKENIQPLKQGRNAEKLGTALQAQTDADIHQQLLAEREQFELLIRIYEGDDPLQPYFEYVHWIEQSFPKHGPESNLVQILENTLTTFKDDERYKQDLRYAELLIKFIDTQPNPLEIYQIVYNQGLCTMCAPFYKAWADELDKNQDFVHADQIYELGIRVKAQPLDMLQEAHLRFQLSVGRRMLGRHEDAIEDEIDCNRQALHKLQKQNIYSARDPTGVPGRMKSQPLSKRGNQNSAPFQIYQGDDEECNTYGEGHGKIFPKHNSLNKENKINPGPWSQNGGKHRSRSQVTTISTPTFQVHEDEGMDKGRGHKPPSVPRALKPRKIDSFTCPLVVFEQPDPTKKPMYCKSKVYAGGREFQFEELRAALYNRRFEQLAIMKMQEVENEANCVKIDVGETLELPEENNEIMADDKEEIDKNEVTSGKLLESQELLYEHNLQIQNTPPQVKIKSASNLEIHNEDQKQIPFQVQNVENLAFQGKTVPLEGNASFFHCQSFTVNTKEALNVVQEMWNSPSPAFGKNPRVSRACLSSPVGLDESGMFKVPAAPPPCKGNDVAIPSELLTKNKPTFSIFTDDEQTPASFQIYSDNVESVQPHLKNVDDNGIDFKSIQNSRQKEIADLHLQPYHPILQPSSSSQHERNICPPASDAATLKLLAFQSDSDDSGDDVPTLNNQKSENIKIHKLLVEPKMPEVMISAPTSEIEPKRKSFGVGVLQHPVFHDEDGYEDMTCNTKAFDFVLPSSTPLVGHLTTAPGQHQKNTINGSYISEEVKRCGTKQELSMIFEASKERYSSSSGSSGSKTQGSVCTVANLEKSLGLLNISGPVNPFCEDLIMQLLSHTGYPKKHHLIGLQRFEIDAPLLHSNATVKLGITKYSVIGELGRGNYAKVLKATKDGKPVALKQQKPAWEWEWYIIQELQSRLPPNMICGYLYMSNGYIYKNASILESEWAKYGSVLSVVNKLKIAGKGHDLNLALLFSIQLFRIVEHLHKCKIIHGDIKPDNFVLCSLPSLEITEPFLKLIDFGRSIDMTLFPEGTTFTTVVTTEGFQCNEMKEGRPWTYQTDLYGLAGTIYCVLFYDYMKVIKKNTKWQLSNKIPRYMRPAVWQEIFSVLLNVDSCENLPDLRVLRETLEHSYNDIDASTVNQSISKLSCVLLNK